MSHIPPKALVLLALVFAGEGATAQVAVSGYVRRDGTYVAPHYRSNPDRSFSNNWSTYGNVNPYTGSFGTRLMPPASSYQSSYGGLGLTGLTPYPPRSTYRSSSVGSYSPTYRSSLDNGGWARPSSYGTYESLYGDTSFGVPRQRTNLWSEPSFGGLDLSNTRRSRGSYDSWGF